MIGTVGLCSGCRSCFDAGWQLGGWKAHRPSYRERVGGGRGPGPDPKGTIFHWPWVMWGTSFAKTNRTAKIFKDQENRSNDILFQHIVNERGSGRIVMFWILKPGQSSEDSRPMWTVGPQHPTGTWLPKFILNHFSPLLCFQHQFCFRTRSLKSVAFFGHNLRI